LTILVILVMRLIGLVTRLARPGGNVTGLSFFFLELVGKCLEQFKQAVPGGVGLLYTRSTHPTFLVRFRSSCFLTPVYRFWRAHAV